MGRGGGVAGETRRLGREIVDSRKWSLLIKEGVKDVELMGICVESVKFETERSVRFHPSLQVHRSTCHNYIYTDGKQA